MRYGDFIQTMTGRKFWPLDPRPEEIYIEDIAHATARLCRFTGHVKGDEIYSVGQHSVMVSRFCPPAYRLWGLLHDAAEAYINDLNRPTKHGPGMAPYRKAEERIIQAIAKRFDLPYPIPGPVRLVDQRMCYTEALELMYPLVKSWLVCEPYDMPIEAWPIRRTQREFLERWYLLESIRQELRKGIA